MVRLPAAAGAPGHEAWGVEVARRGSRVGAARRCRTRSPSTSRVRPELLVKLPPELAGRPFPGEALGCAMNVFARSGSSRRRGRDRRRRLPRAAARPARASAPVRVSPSFSGAPPALELGRASFGAETPAGAHRRAAATSRSRPPACSRPSTSPARLPARSRAARHRRLPPGRRRARSTSSYGTGAASTCQRARARPRRGPARRARPPLGRSPQAGSTCAAPHPRVPARVARRGVRAPAHPAGGVRQGGGDGAVSAVADASRGSASSASAGSAALRLQAIEASGVAEVAARGRRRAVEGALDVASTSCWRSSRTGS